MRNRKTLIQLFLALLDDISSIVDEHANIDESINKKQKHQQIKQCKDKVKNKLHEDNISEIEDEIFSALLNIFSDFSDVTGLFSKIKNEVVRKEEIAEKMGAGSNKVIISHRIQDYLDKNSKRITELFAYYKKGREYLKLGKIKEAINHYTQAIKFDSTNEDFYLERGKAFAILGNRDQAIQDYSKVIKLNASNIAAYYYRGREYKKRFMYNDIYLTFADEDFKKIMELPPKNAFDYSYRGLALSHLSLLAEAIDAHNEALTKNPDSARVYLNRAISNQISGDPSFAYVLLDACMALHMDPADHTIQCEIDDLFSSLFLSIQDPKKIFDRIKQINNPELQIIILNAILNKKLPLIKWFSTRLSIFDKYFTSGLLNQIRNYSNELINKDENLKNAITEDSAQIILTIKEYYQRHVEKFKWKIAGENARKYCRFAWASFKTAQFFYENCYPTRYYRDHYKKTLSYFTNALQCDSHYAEAYKYRGFCLLRMPKSELWNMVQDLNKAREMAIADLTKYIELTPQNAEGHFLLGEAYTELCEQKKFQSWEDVEQAIISYSKAIELDPKRLEFYLKRASFYLYLNEVASAKSLTADMNLIGRALSDRMMAREQDTTIPDSKLTRLMNLRLNQIILKNEDVLVMIKEMPQLDVQIKLLNYTLFETSLFSEMLKPFFSNANDIIKKLKDYRNELVRERNDVRNAAIVLAQAHRQNRETKSHVLLGYRKQIDATKENRFYTLAPETFQHIRFFSSSPKFPTVLDEYSANHPVLPAWPSAKGAQRLYYPHKDNNDKNDQPDVPTIKLKM